MYSIGEQRAHHLDRRLSSALLLVYFSKNSDRMCTESTTAIGIRKIGIIELMMWTGKPRPIRIPIVDSTVTIAMIIGETISTS